MAEKREDFKYVASLPEGEQFVDMILFKNTLFVASTKSVYALHEKGNNPGLKTINIRVEDEADAG